MTLSKGVNSYVSREDANLYFADRLDTAAWSDASDLLKDQALTTATSILDTYQWTGVVVSEAQPLAFPRNGEFFDPRLGYITTLKSTEVPKQIMVATYELAYHLLNNDGILDNTGSVTALTAGQINLSNIRAAPTLPPMVLRQIKPLLVNRGSNTWYRRW